MAVRSRDRLRQLPLHLDCDPVYTRCGWLFLVDAESALAAAENSIMQDEEGVDSVEVDDLHEYLPGAEGAGIAYALYEPDSGFADPVATTRRLRRGGAPRRRDARSRARRSSAIEVADGRGSRRARRRRAGRVRQRRPRRGPVVARARARDRARAAARGHARAGRRLRRRRRAGRPVRGVVAGRPGLPAAGARARRRVTSWSAAASPRSTRRSIPMPSTRPSTTAFEPDVRDRVATRLPGLAGMRRSRGRVGLYDVTPDWHPLLGPVDGYEGLHLATGGSGHCFKLGAGDRRARRGRDHRQAGELRERRDVLALALRRGPRARIELRREPRVTSPVDGPLRFRHGARHRTCPKRLPDFQRFRLSVTVLMHVCCSSVTVPGTGHVRSGHGGDR